MKAPVPTSAEGVNELICRVMAQHPGRSPRQIATYFEAVHQVLAPEARRLEQENIALRARLSAKDQQFHDMGMLIARLATKLKKLDPEEPLVGKAMEYLDRKGYIAQARKNTLRD
ncbi:MAG: hypothetical protein Q7V53_02800 [Caldisericota bacterium]|nr:hypothetical protein [Caldisericota bacterium]